MKINRASRTAEGIAAARARESAMPEGERLFYDPYARLFLPIRYRLVVRIRPLRDYLRRENARLLPGMLGGLIVRTRYIDDYVKNCCVSGIRQLVILGAGYDARALRIEELKRPEIRIFEVDHPATQKRKLRKLAGILGKVPDHVIYVPVRFNSQRLSDALFQHGYQDDLKTLFIWEGVTMYLNAEAVDTTLSFIAGDSAGGSSVIFDYFPPSVVDGSHGAPEVKALRKNVRRMGEEFRFGIQNDQVETFMAARGFTRIRNVTARQCSEIYLNATNRKISVSGLFSFVIAEVPDFI